MLSLFWQRSYSSAQRWSLMTRWLAVAAVVAVSVAAAVVVIVAVQPTLDGFTAVADATTRGARATPSQVAR
jgi:hypothetical protein